MTVKAKNTLFLLFVITDRSRSKTAEKVLKRNDVGVMLRTMGLGTAKTRLLEYLGLGDKERDVLMCSLTRREIPDILEDLEATLKAGRNGSGIAFTVPMKSVAGPHTLKLLRGGDAEETCELKGECAMDAPSAELIISIVNRGYAGEVMDAARAAGAQGGTVLRARGTGSDETAKFYKITVEPEKDILLLLVRRDVRSDVIRAICKAAGLKTSGRGIVFSLPVQDVIGAYGIDDHVGE